MTDAPDHQPDNGEPGQQMVARETLYSLARAGDRSPLLIVVATDRSGHMIDLSACDPDDYD